MTHNSDEFENSDIRESEMTQVLNHCDVQIQPKKNVDFEDALNETGFGKYNVYLILACGIVLFASMTESYGVGYILPASECELNLNSYTKGILTSTNVIGTMCSCPIWGYLSDLKGRKNLVVINLILAFITGFLAAFTPSFWGFCILRLINGVCISCPAALVFVYLDEFLSTSTKAKSMAWSTAFISLAMISLPALGWILLQSSVEIGFLGLYLNNWRIFMLVNSTPSILAALALMKLPESPKYLYHRGKVEEALKILKKMYTSNTGNSECNFPVLNLDEKIMLASETNNDLYKGLSDQIVPLFKPPLLTYTLASCTMQGGAFAVSAGLYFWYPDIIKQISNSGKTSVTVCEALSFNHDSEKDSPHCNQSVSDSIFILNIIIGATYLLAYATWGVVVKLLGTRNFFITCMGLSAVSTAAICVLSNRTLIDIVFISALSLSGISVTVINAWVVDIFPTQICGVALCLVLTVGRLGSIISSSIVGIMLEWNCLSTFFLYALNLYVWVFLYFYLKNVEDANPHFPLLAGIQRTKQL